MRQTVRVPHSGLELGQIELSRESTHYIHNVHRLSAGTEVELFDPAKGLRARARIIEASPVGLVEVFEISQGLVTSFELNWVQALAKGDKVDNVVQDATELGATSIVIASTNRTVVNLEGKEEARRKRYEKIAAEAARQSLRSDAPKIVGPLTWQQIVEQYSRGLRLLLHPHSQTHIRALRDELTQAKSVTLAVGPEGGWAQDEVDLAEKHGWQIVTLGSRVLRTETMASAMLGALLLLRDG